MPEQTPMPRHEENTAVPTVTEHVAEVRGAETSASERRPFVIAKRAGSIGGKGDNTTRMLIAFGVTVVVLIAFLGVVSTKGGKKKTAAQSGKPNLGRVVAPSDPGDVVPADKMTATQNEQVRGIGAEEIEKTRTPKFRSPNQNTDGSAAPATSKTSLGQIPKFEKPDTNSEKDWSPEPYGSGKASNAASQGQLAKAEEEEYGNASLVFVAHGMETSANASAGLLPSINNFGLGSGYHVAARLESMASTALQAPVTAVIEYNYERDGHALIPAGARAVGKISQADASGIMNITFDSIEMPTGESVPISAVGTTTSLEAIKGEVTGKHVGRSIAVRSLAGLGEAGAMLVGKGNMNSAYSESDMIRERAAENVGNAGDAQVTGLMTTQHIVVSVPAGTEIYLVFTKRQKVSPTNAQAIAMPPAEQ